MSAYRGREQVSSPVLKHRGGTGEGQGGGQVGYRPPYGPPAPQGDVDFRLPPE